MEHLFISYAIEDAPLARWLTLKLTIAGYKVWCFEFQMLGGESFPKEIDTAIKARTFRMLGLISRTSVKKDNPVKEWTLAQALGKDRKIDFLIPLNVDGIKPVELPWTLSDTNWISFSSLGWAGAFRQLLKLLEKLGAPRSTPSATVITPGMFLQEGVQTNTEEELISNSVRFRSIPALLREFRPGRELNPREKSDLRDLWPYYRVSDECFIAFGSPPDDVPAGVMEATGQTWDWKIIREIHGVNTHNLVSNLLRASVTAIFVAGGCRFGTNTKPLYFPAGLYEKDRLAFTSYKGRRTYVATKGRSTFYRRGEPQTCNYFLGFRHSIVRSRDGEWLVYFKLYLRVTQASGQEFEAKPAMARRKAISKGWWNDKLLNRYLALCAALNGFQGLRRFRDGVDQVLVEPTLISFTAPGGIDESCFNEIDNDDDDGSKVTATLSPEAENEEDENDHGDQNAPVP